ncbi:MAG: hypothetical protein ACF8Q5_08945 [Phycisphaerales bacterium JB040]
MPRETPWEDEYTLLCERCGYVIEGLATVGNCPECGRPIAESLPERRPGTAWQQHRTFQALIRTSWETLRHPSRTLRVMRFDQRNSLDLGTQYAILTGLWLTVSLSLPLFLLRITDLSGGADGGRTLFAASVLALGGLGVMMLLGFVVAIVIAALTAVERLGLRVLANRHGYRITRPIAIAITAHGSVGWLAGSLVATPFLVSGWVLSAASKTGADSIVWTGLGLLGFLTGFLFFETFAWLGLRRLKYANTPRPAEESDGPVAGAPGS